jgi:hypothetical protein
MTANEWDEAAKDLYAKFQAGTVLPADMVICPHLDLERDTNGSCGGGVTTRHHCV